MWSPRRIQQVYGDLTTRRASFEILPAIPVAPGDDLAACRDRVRPGLAFYLGGMGARTQNFYADLIRRYGYEREADTIQDLFLAGRRAEAAAAIPDALVDELSLVGPPSHLAEQLAAWEGSGVDGLLVRFADDAALRAIAEVAF